MLSSEKSISLGKKIFEKIWYTDLYLDEILDLFLCMTMTFVFFLFFFINTCCKNKIFKFALIMSIMGWSTFAKISFIHIVLLQIFLVITEFLHVCLIISELVLLSGKS